MTIKKVGAHMHFNFYSLNVSIELERKSNSGALAKYEIRLADPAESPPPGYNDDEEYVALRRAYN